jgi:hypothetical protein
MSFFSAHKTDEETDNMTESYGITAKSTVEIEDFTHEIEEEDMFHCISVGGVMVSMLALRAIDRGFEP